MNCFCSYLHCSSLVMITPTPSRKKLSVSVAYKSLRKDVTPASGIKNGTSCKKINKITTNQLHTFHLWVVDTLSVGIISERTYLLSVPSVRGIDRCCPIGGGWQDHHGKDMRSSWSFQGGILVGRCHVQEIWEVLTYWLRPFEP